MMRYLFMTLLGFFGPALLMLFLRLLWYRVRYAWLSKKQEPEIIDITPTPKGRPSRLFISAWVAISLLCTGLLLWHMDDTPASEQVYIPAHINAEGDFVPAQTLVPKE